MTRGIPELRLASDPHVHLAAQGWDTVQEAFALAPDLSWLEDLRTAKGRAADAQDDLEGIVPVPVGPELLNVHATGAKGGFAYRLSNDDFILMIGSPKREWTISVRYLAAGLWQHGLEALRERAFACLRDVTTQATLDCVRVSRVDWCFDFYAPDFADEMVPSILDGVVHHPMAKDMSAGQAPVSHVGHTMLQTITVGSKAGCQVQLYDKTREIDELSGKTWFYDVWKAGLGFDPWPNERPSGIWRLECRFASDFLKERNVRRPFEVTEHRTSLVAEALVNRRIGVRSWTDGKRTRWPVHPLWSEAIKSCAVDHLVPVGRKVTGRRSELEQRGLRQLAGFLRTLGILSVGGDDEASRKELVDKALEMVESDPHHLRKVNRAMDRYATVDAAR